MKSKKASKSGGNEQRAVARMYKTIHQDKRIYQRWVAGPEASISTSAGGLVVLTTVANAASINATADFSSLAALYTSYRCKAIRVDFFPQWSSPVYTGATTLNAPAVVAAFPSFANTVPTTFQQALDTSGLKLMSGYKGGTIMTSYRGDPDAHLWTGTGAAIGSNEQFLVSIVGTALTSTPSIAIFRYVPQYLVEFRITG